MSIGTNTQVEAISKVKMATATLFLGGAALAASAAGGLANQTPDLVIESVTFEKAVDESEIKPGSPPKSMYDTYTVTYKNIGKKSTAKPFAILVYSVPPAYMTWGGGDPVKYLVGTNDAFEQLTQKAATQLSKNQYLIPVSSKLGDSALVPGLNKYTLSNLAPNNSGQVKIYISKFYQEMMPQGKAKMNFTIDYVSNNTGGTIKESNENNNSKLLYVDKSKYSQVPANLCGFVDPAIGASTCKDAGGSFVCIDKYTQEYSGCVKQASECATKAPCEMDIANGQPYIEKVAVIVNAKYAKTFEMSYAKGTFKPNEITLYYPHEFNDKVKSITVLVTAKNAGSNVQYGYLQQGDEVADTAIVYPSDENLDFKNFLSPKLTWGTSPKFSFNSGSASLKLYVGLDNKDATYFGFPKTQFLDDGIVLNVLPAEPLPGSDLQPIIQSLEISGDGQSIVVTESKAKGNLPNGVNAESTWVPKKEPVGISGPINITVTANAINTDQNTKYAFIKEHKGWVDPIYYFKNMVPFDLSWSESPNFTFTTYSNAITVYAFVSNLDGYYLPYTMDYNLDDYTHKTVKLKEPTTSPTVQPSPVSPTSTTP